MLAPEEVAVEVGLRMVIPEEMEEVPVGEEEEEVVLITEDMTVMEGMENKEQ
jgi:hypothetical protein